MTEQQDLFSRNLAASTVAGDMLDLATRSLDESESLDDARARFRGFLHENKGKRGMPCPCCERHAQIYRNKINANRARGLFWLIRSSLDGGVARLWVDVAETAPRWLVRSNQLSFLRHWRLVERRGNNDDSTRKHTGIWRPTELGIRYAQGEERVPLHVFTLFDRVVKFSDEVADVRAAAGVDFDYGAMMRGEW